MPCERSRRDTTRHEIVLRDIHSGAGRGKWAGTGTGTGTGQGTTGDKNTSTIGQDRNKTGGAGGTEPGRDKMTFHVAENATITLDGRKAEFSQLKEGLYARVHVRQGDRGAGTGTGTDKGTGTTDKNATGGTGTDKDNKAGAGRGARMETDRIEAFTKDQTGTGTGAGK